LYINDPVADALKFFVKRSSGKTREYPQGETSVIVHLPRSGIVITIWQCVDSELVSCETESLFLSKRLVISELVILYGRILKY
jgi:hypothetical protein